jgi:hypothetical protein
MNKQIFLNFFVFFLLNTNADMQPGNQHKGKIQTHKTQNRGKNKENTEIKMIKPHLEQELLTLRIT